MPSTPVCISQVETCWCVIVKIGSRVVPFLVDTGASVNIISTAAFHSLCLEEGQRPSDIQISGVDGNLVPVRGEVGLDIEIEGEGFSVDALIADITGVRGILGLPFLRDQGCVVRVSEGVMECQGRRWDLSYMPEMAEVSLVCQTLLPQENTDAQVEVKTRGHDWTPCRDVLDRLGLLPITDGITWGPTGATVRLRNVGDSPVHITVEVGIGAVTSNSSHLASQIGQATMQSDLECTPPTPVIDPLDAFIARSTERLETKNSAVVKKLIENHVDLFVGPNRPLGQTKLVLHEIPTGNATPIRQPMRRMAPAHREIVDQEVKQMLEDGIIEPSTSGWSSPVVLVRKKGSVTPRFCIDFREVNNVTIKDAYAIANIQDCLDALKGAQYFCCMDLASGYWQVALHPRDKEKTAFPTRQGLFQFTVMAFGLTNAPGTFQRLMEQVLRGLQWRTALAYLDDLVVFGRTFEETLERLQEVLQRLRQAGLKLKPSKCNFFQTEVRYLGHIIGREGVACDHEKIEAVQQWDTPTTAKQVRSFLRLAGYYRRFIPEFYKLAAPLTELTKKNQRFDWTGECNQAFINLKSCLTSAPVLAYPSEEVTDVFLLDTDASDTAIGCVLSQIQNGEERVIAYGSKKLNPSQRAYCVTYRELLAVVEFVRHFRHHLLGRKFRVRTDHSSLRWLLNFRDSGEGLIGRWLARLAIYDFTIEHRSGATHSNADALSRIEFQPRRRCDRKQCSECKNTTSAVQTIHVTEPPSSNSDLSWTPAYTPEEMSQLQEKDDDIL